MKAKGRIVKILADTYFILAEDGVYEGRVAGRFRIAKSVPRAGDLVHFTVQKDGLAYVTEILPRQNVIVRPALANIDQMVIVCAAAPPVTDPILIDKLTVLAVSKGIAPILCVNKTDLAGAEFFAEIYDKTPFPLLTVSAKSGAGLAALAALLPGKLTVFVGNSGVGKSSILNMLIGEERMAIGEISRKIGRGRHTTRHSELIVHKGGFIADTPGFSTFDLVRMEICDKNALQEDFPEFAPYLGRCRFNDCTHRTEPDCRVLEAVARGDIAPCRHESYRIFYDYLDGQKNPSAHGTPRL